MKRLIALTVALGISLTMSIAVAPASQAVEAGKYEVQHLPGYPPEDGVYSLSVDNRARSNFISLYPKGYRDNYKWATSGYFDTATAPEILYIPQGKCVWEEVWGNLGKTWYGNFTYCNQKDAVRGRLVVLEGSKLREANGIESRLRIVRYSTNISSSI